MILQRANNEISFKPRERFARQRGKELDEETGLYYYGARYYNPQVSTWLSVDALSHLSPNQTPYHFVSNNPVMRIDPDGLTDYELAEDGTTSVVESTIDNGLPDRLIAGKATYNDKGDLTSTNYITLSDGVMDSKQKSNNGAGVDFTIYSIEDNKEAKAFFEFVAKNSDVEWSHVSYVGQSGSDYNDITTSHSDQYEAGGIYMLNELLSTGMDVYFYNHSHPVNNFMTKFNFKGPSGHHPKDKHRKTNGGDGGDIQRAKEFYETYPNHDVKFNIYDVRTRSYVPYNHQGVIHR